jgi:heme exporter protein C
VRAELTVRVSRWLGAATLVSLTATVALGLTLPKTAEQKEYSRLIAIHPPIAWVFYVSFGVTALASVLYLWPRTRSRMWDLIAASSAEISAVFAGLTLVTGSIWGRPTWGVYWTWDARLTLTALIAAMILGYLALRRVPGETEVKSKRSAVYAVLVALLIPVDHFAVDWWRTLHQDSSIETASHSLDPSFLAAMGVGFLAFTLLYAWLLVHRFRLEQLEERLDSEGLELALAERRAEAMVG